MATFLYRLMGAAMLDAGTYEQVESDRGATWQAVVVVLLASLAAGTGLQVQLSAGPIGFLRLSVVALVTWIAWAVLTVQIGTRFLPERQTESDAVEMMRTIGFAATPGLLQVFGVIPGVGVPVFVITTVWMFAAMVAAVKHALDYTTVGRALAVCGLAAFLVLMFAIGLAVLLTSNAS
jgi:Yip1 domain